jgi:hypothetical protein
LDGLSKVAIDEMLGGQPVFRPADAAQRVDVPPPHVETTCCAKTPSEEVLWQAIALAIVMILSCFVGLYLGMHYEH